VYEYSQLLTSQAIISRDFYKVVYIAIHLLQITDNRQTQIKTKTITLHTLQVWMTGQLPTHSRTIFSPSNTSVSKLDPASNTKLFTSPKY